MARQRGPRQGVAWGRHRAITTANSGLQKREANRLHRAPQIELGQKGIGSMKGVVDRTPTSPTLTPPFAPHQFTDATKGPADAIEVVEVPVAEVGEDARLDPRKKVVRVGGEVDQGILPGRMPQDCERQQPARPQQHRVDQHARAREVEDEGRVAQPRELHAYGAIAARARRSTTASNSARSA